VFDARGGTVAEFFAYEATFTGGVRVAIGAVAGSTNNPEIMTMPASGGGPRLKTFHYSAVNKDVFVGFEEWWRGGYVLASGDGKVFINSTYNNTIVTLTDTVGNVLSWANAGLAGFKGPKKSTPYAAQIITRIAVEKAKEYGLAEVKVFVKGVGTGRESAVRALNANGLNITYIKDITPLPHNGCRSRKPRRV
jgi:small subunit ribosomal protein S11